MTKQTPLSAVKIEDARKRIDPIFLNTNLLRSERFGLSLVVKDETQNPIRSFKGRGTGYFLADLATGRTLSSRHPPGTSVRGLPTMPRGMGDLWSSSPV
ncbi:hypothetical protein P6U16_09870 [Rhizobium sp. 32-5/1]|nr:hypothetical protein [Rhizobium sp. 32-5/1]WEZ84813.1 hypothetical protein P6U16_09870 [Rhizobium sp. 32-5/1]